jgi:NADPH:quinone reductase-like Zn-dependent oxidoreductase
MKAWELSGYGIENLKLTEKSEPKPGPNEVLVRMSAVSLNYRDKLVVEGLYNPNMSFPIVQVADGVGEVVDAGKSVTRFRRGDRIMTHYATRWIDGQPQGDETTHTLGNTISGALAEYIVMDEQSVVRVPDYLTDEEASTLPCAGLTAWYALVEKGQLLPDQTVLIQGTGGVSIFGLQIASAIGAQTIVTSSSDEKLERVRSLGASHGINYARTPQWENVALDLTAKKGVDHVLEVVGGKSLVQSVSAIKAGGHIAVIGILESFTSDLPLFPILVKQVVLRGYSVGPRRALEEMNQAFAKWQIRPVIDTVYPFGDGLAAYEHLYRGAFGKIVIRIRD